MVQLLVSKKYVIYPGKKQAVKKGFVLGNLG